MLIETAQDLLQAKAALIGARRAFKAAGRKLPLFAQVTIETTGTMLLGTEIGAALTALEPLGIDAIGLNCATGPAEMSEHLRHLSRHSRVALTCMPNAGLPVLGPNGAELPADARRSWPTPTTPSPATTASPSSAAAAAPRPSTCGRWSSGSAAVSSPRRKPHGEASCSSLYAAVPFRQDSSVLMVGERTNTNGSKAFREALLDSRWHDVVEMARDATRDGAHVLDVCVDYVGRDGAIDMHEVAARYATASTLPIMLDSTEPAVIEAGLENLGGRCIVNSVNFEDGDGPESRWARVLPIITEHGAAVVALCIDETGPGPHRRAQGRRRRAAHRHARPRVGDPRGRHPRRLPDLHARHRSGGVARRRRGDHRGHPRAQARAARACRPSSACRTSPSASRRSRASC